MRRSIGTGIAAGAFAWAVSPSAHAGGFEYPENGSIAMGRGGAFVARASDPTAVMLNPAGIVGLDGLQITVSANMPFLNNCFTRGSADGTNPGTYAMIDFGNPNVTGTPFNSNTSANGDTYTGQHYPQVCNQTPFFVAPQILATYRINDWIGVGLGVFGPNSVGQQSFPTTVMTMSEGMAPSPSRYMLINENLLLFHLTASVAVKPVRWLRIGFGIQPSFAMFQFTTMANSLTPMAQSPASDIETSVTASGWFPAFNAGIQLVARRFWELGGSVQWNPDSVNLTGTGTAHDGFYNSTPGTNGINCMPAPSPPNSTSCFTVAQMTVHLPYNVKFGGRLAYPRAGAPALNSPHYDPMRDDLFDVEIDAMYERSSVFTNLSLTNTGSINAGGTRVPAPNVAIPHNWNDVWGIRIGGDVNVVPNVFQFRLGVSYELGAASPTYAQLDVPTYTTLGLHVGASVHVWKLVVSVAYGHFFMDSITVAPAPGMNVTTVGTMGALVQGNCTGPSATAGADACAVNVGRYDASMDVINLGITARF